MTKSIQHTIAGALAAVLLIAPAGAESPLLKEFQEAFISLGEAVLPSVVEITSQGGNRDEQSREELFRFFGTPDGGGEEGERGEGGEGQPGPPENQGPRPPSIATGSGFIFDSAGHIVTNNHVVEGAEKITVHLSNGKELPAEVVGRDPDTDVAVVKIDPTGLDLKPVTVGDSDLLKVGQFAVALGSPRGLTGSISFGHVSGLGRERLNLPDDKLRFQHFIQTDAAINLGNSGGPLCDIDGNVIGINIAIVFGANSIGFAIPINRIKAVVPQLIADGHVVRGWLGVQIREVAAQAGLEGVEVKDFVEALKLPDEQGAWIDKLTPQGPAEKSGLKPEDVVYRIDGTVVKDGTDLINQISMIKPGTVSQLDVWREGQEIKVAVEIGEYRGREMAIFGPDVLGIHVTKLEADPERLKEFGYKEDLKGVLAGAIVPKSPAEEAGLRRGDIIVKIAHKDVGDLDSFRALIKENAEPGKTLLIRVARPNSEDESKFVKVPDDFKF